MCENKAETNEAVGTTSVPIENELSCKYCTAAIAASIEPRARRVNEVRIVSQQREKRVIFLRQNTYIYI